MIFARRHLKLLSLVTDKTDNAIIIIDNKWQATYVNQGFSTLFGFTQDDILGASPISIIAPHLIPSHIDFIRTWTSQLSLDSF
ncbi:PAS domain S-box protein [Pseudoalteromonas sp. MMG010]|uniref:PAS domain S-box protein n=1 Tax=Pseudoalteromonas sp. MMG010 TaxID=2822685 RepID=UPI001FFD1E70|nr:PAS domain S-box protein [Pseudoalteromonas sp. MMG010]